MTHTTNHDGAPLAWYLRALESSFGCLNELRPGLAARAAAYVMHGEQPEVLQELAQAPGDAADLLGHPGSLYAYLNLQNTRQRKLGEDSRHERRQFYGVVDTGNTPPELLIRLGKLLAAADQRKSLKTAGTSLPDWVSYLLNDGYLRDDSGFHRVEAKAKGAGRWRPTVAGLLALLRADEIEQPELQLLHLLIDRKNLSTYEPQMFEDLLKLADLDAFLLEHAALTRALPPQLSAQGRLVLSPLLARPALAGAFPDLLVRLAVDDSKAVRTDAAQRLERIPLEQRVSLLDEVLKHSSHAGERTQAADLMSRSIGERSRELLQQALEAETYKSVRQAIAQALTRLQAAGAMQEAPEIPDYAQPELLPLGADCLPLLQENLQQMLAQARANAAQEIADNVDSKHMQKWRQNVLAELEKIDDARLTAALRWLGGETNEQPPRGQIGQVLSHQGRLLARPEFSLCHVLRLMSLRRELYFFFADAEFQQWFRRQSTPLDLRAIADALVAVGLPLRLAAGACLQENYQGCYPQHLLPADCVWPFFTLHPEFLEEGLGLLASSRDRQTREFTIAQTIEVLDCLPQIPPKLVPRLFEFALGDTKSYRDAAQALLARQPGIGTRVAEYLGASGQELRSAAAQWLGELGDASTIPALNQALAKETRETVRAAMLTALEALGVDIGPMLAPSLLLAEAQKGLKAKAPAGLAWFSFDALPRAAWNDGGEVAPEILRWWVVLATKLKEPGGNGLLDRYLGSLEPESRAHLGENILTQFIAQDVRTPSLEDATAVADAGVAARYAGYQQAVKWAPELAAMTEAQVHEQIKRERLSVYLGSAIGEKGMLALISGVRGHRLASVIGTYMRDHHTRRAQIEALLEGAANSSDPAAMQLLLGVARRHRTASVQLKARDLVEYAARRMGWTQDQLADRTVPSAGFDEMGVLEIEYGERSFSVRLDEAVKPALSNSEGKVVAALPEPRKGDDPEQIKLAKQLLATCKKETKQVVDSQTARLYEAMCSGRAWPRSDWQEFLAQHPIVGRLLQRLLWIEDSSNGQRIFRPSEDGALLDASDDEVELSADSAIRLAHAALMDAPARAAWKRHLKDYKIKPLFAQLDRELPSLPADALEIADRLGWCADTFTFRGAFTKLGFSRAAAEDGGCFYAYFKDFASIGVRATVEFSGSTLPEQNLAAALKTLSYEKLGNRGGDARIALGKLPPVLLAETYADYCQVAAAGSGFDAEWEKKTPW